tara:strand:+ start:228 stop:419 length:192 start_codon:yes stop_codon:yes gene_type:complete
MVFDYQGKVLRWIAPDGILRNGEIVYCFVQEESQFRVQTRRLIHGVDQVIFSNSSWDKFRVVP